MCTWDSYVYEKGVLCFLIRKSYVRSIKTCCFVRKYAAIPVQLEIFILLYIGWCVLIIWTFIFNYYYYYYYYYFSCLYYTLSGYNMYRGWTQTDYQNKHYNISQTDEGT
jgi:hypothetical protein